MGGGGDQLQATDGSASKRAARGQGDNQLLATRAVQCQEAAIAVAAVELTMVNAQC